MMMRSLMSVFCRSSALASCAMAMALSACSLTPDYERPVAPVKDQWPLISPEQSGTGPRLADLAWKQVFRDPALQGLIETALQNNRDLRMAALNIEVARAAYRISEADLLPNVDATLSESLQRTSRHQSTSWPQQASTTRTYRANLGVTAFELDLFGRLRSLEQQALEKYLSTEQAARSTRITLIAEVANAYLTLLGDRKLLALTEETQETREKSLFLIERSFEKGVSSELDVAQARTAVETARANRARYIRQTELDKNALVLLLGKDVSLMDLPGTLDQVTLVADAPVGLPSQVLLQRPDIMQAEHSLKAANANIGAARAAFFPSIALTGTAGFASPSLGNLFSGGGTAWAFTPSVSLPIFDAGRNQAELDSARASKDVAVAQYEKTIQTAFREVSDALAIRATLQQQLDAQQRLVEATQTSYRLSQARYGHGVDSYLNVLDSQRSLYAAQQDLVSLQVSRLSNSVTLYKTLGGGMQ